MGLNSHQALADLLKVSWQTVQLWEKEGGTAPNRSRLPLVAKALNVSAEWLLSGNGNMHDSNSLGGINDPIHSEPLDVRGNREDFIDPDELMNLINLYRNSTRDGRSHIVEVAGLVEKVSVAGMGKAAKD